MIEFQIETGAETIVYRLDSAAVLDSTNEHFSCVITCENVEMAFDGMSISRIKPMQWKANLNRNEDWTFKGSDDEGVSLLWNFQTCYHQLMYYRV